MKFKVYENWFLGYYGATPCFIRRNDKNSDWWCVVPYTPVFTIVNSVSINFHAPLVIKGSQATQYRLRSLKENGALCFCPGYDKKLNSIIVKAFSVQ